MELSPPINSETLRNQVEKDNLLKHGLPFVIEGSPEKPYFNRSLPPTVNKNLLCLHTDASREVIPVTLQILSLLHKGHWSIVAYNSWRH